MVMLQLVLAARNIAYGETNVVWMGPTFASAVPSVLDREVNVDVTFIISPLSWFFHLSPCLPSLPCLPSSPSPHFLLFSLILFHAYGEAGLEFRVVICPNGVETDICSGWEMQLEDG